MSHYTCYRVMWVLCRCVILGLMPLERLQIGDEGYIRGFAQEHLARVVFC